VLIVLVGSLVNVLLIGVNMVNLLLLSVFIRLIDGLILLFMVFISVVSSGLFDVVVVMGFLVMFLMELVLFGMVLV